MYCNGFTCKYITPAVEPARGRREVLLAPPRSGSPVVWAQPGPLWGERPRVVRVAWAGEAPAFPGAPGQDQLAARAVPAPGVQFPLLDLGSRWAEFPRLPPVPGPAAPPSGRYLQGATSAEVLPPGRRSGQGQGAVPGPWPRGAPWRTVAEGGGSGTCREVAWAQPARPSSSL